MQKFAADYQYEVEEIPEFDIDDIAVSSTRIRNALLSGDVQTAHHCLGYPFQLSGKVIKGDQLGRTLGYPTANLFIEENYKIIPADGIYAVSVEIGGIDNAMPFHGMAYIGHRPTINGMTRNIEVNIFEFDQEIYGHTLRLHFLHYIRGDEKFDSLEELTSQLRLDEKCVKDLLRKV